ncbi:hypothetical protein PENSPDRAFT_754036 [Peniophora sp. CONT]|nr:hypothetical protein PENSPDRAFT_754036 [Peniophora sp. CONT]
MENAVVNPWDQVVRTRLTARQASETLSNHRQRMEDDVEHLQRALVLAMELRNSSAPILTLPDEVILQIFLAVRDLFYPLPRHVEKLPSSSWLVVAAVCRRLRRVAMASPGLHTCVSSRILSKRLVMRELDLSYPLDINLDVGAPHDNIASVTILNYFRLHGHRIRSCSMQVDTNSVESFIASHNRNWLPYARNIESLVISSATGIWYHGMSTIRFENTLPKLNRLELDCVRLDFTSTIFINLTELTLNHVRLNEVHHLQEASSHFHSLLGRMQHLERLALIDV